MTNIYWLLKMGLWEQASICLDEDCTLERSEDKNENQIVRVYRSYRLFDGQTLVGGIFNGIVVY